MKTPTDKPTFWQLTETPDKGCEGVADLAHWSTNYDLKNSTPFQIFLDLIGWSVEEFGEPFVEPKDYPSLLGFVEMGKLASALKEYSDSPTCVENFVAKLMESDE